MADESIKLSIMWISLMLVYFLGDVLRIFSGDFNEMELDGKKITKNMYFGISIIMLVPILMVIANLFLPYPFIRWTNIVVSIFFFLFNAVGLPTYPSLYDKFLILVGLVLNVGIVYLAWTW